MGNTRFLPQYVYVLLSSQAVTHNSLCRNVRGRDFVHALLLRSAVHLRFW